MDHSWRPPPLPPIPGNISNICPICSTSHFPFCPPPAFIENPRFLYPQSQSDFYHQRPRFDHHHPFPNHQSSISYNYGYNPIGGHVGKRPTWYGSNPSLDMSPYDAIGDPAMANGNYNSYHTAGVGSAPYGHDGYDNGGSKRMKIEPVDHNMGPRGSSEKPKVSSDNERILKLIHDHGNAANNIPGGLPKVGADLASESNGENANRYAHQRFGETHSLDYGRHNSQPARQFTSTEQSESKGHHTHSSFGNNFSPLLVPHAYCGQPPLPASPPPPLPLDPSRNHYFEPLASAPVKKPSLFPIAVSTSADSSSSSSHSAIHENQSSAQVYYTNNIGHHATTLSIVDVQPFPLGHLPSEKPNIIDASRIFKQPHRASRPDHLVVILRGLPGSGKSYLAKVLRDIEVENGGQAPRIHSMDEYFMTEVEKAEDNELSKSSGSLRGKRQLMKKVMEYCYEPEMEEAYRASMLKAFKKTLDEGVYSFIIVDDRNLRVADFAQFWATAKRSGYEVYIVEASYKDPAGCAARNVHNFSLDDIQKMAGQWEEAPSLYLKMDVKSLLHGDGFDEGGIQEVEMDMEDEEAIDDASKGSEINTKDDDPVINPRPEVKDLSTSKWSNYTDGNEEGEKKKGSALSGLIQAYNKEGKSVHWGDQGGNVGFLISATRKTNTRSLVIGPGSGYNLKSNPLSEEEYVNVKPAEPKSQNVFQERIRAECESFKAVFDKRRQRIVDHQ